MKACRGRGYVSRDIPVGAYNTETIRHILYKQYLVLHESLRNKNQPTTIRTTKHIPWSSAITRIPAWSDWSIASGTAWGELVFSRPQPRLHSHRPLPQSSLTAKTQRTNPALQAIRATMGQVLVRRNPESKKDTKRAIRPTIRIIEIQGGRVWSDS